MRGITEQLEHPLSLTQAHIACCLMLVGLAAPGCARFAASESSPVSSTWAGGGTQKEFAPLPGLASLEKASKPSAEAAASAAPKQIADPGTAQQWGAPAPRARITRLDRASPSVPYARRFAVIAAHDDPCNGLVLLPAPQQVQNPQVQTRQPYAAFSPQRLPQAVNPVGYHQAAESLPAPEVAPNLLPGPMVATEVSDTFIETDIRQAVQSLATQAGTSVVLDDQIRGTVTATIENVSFETALRQVLDPLGFVFRPVEGSYYIGVAEPESALFDFLTQRYRYTALHRSPEELVSMVSERRRKFLRASPTGGWIIVEAPEHQATRVLQELEELDTPVPQVVLEALICVYSPQTSFRFGFDLDAGVRIFDRSTNLAVNGLALTGVLGDAAGANLNDFHVTHSVLRLLEQKGFVKIRASPRVMAQDGEKARIHIGRESFFSVQPETTGLLFRQDVQQVESGIMLEITPAVRAPIVTVKIDRAEVSEDIRSDETQANASDRFPVINRRSVTTTVHVQDGETIVIGGLTQRQKVDQLNQTPVLGRIPFVGKLFQRIEKVDQMVEVAIFISPRIVNCGSCRATYQTASNSKEAAHETHTASGDLRFAPVVQ